MPRAGRPSFLLCGTSSILWTFLGWTSKKALCTTNINAKWTPDCTPHIAWIALVVPVVHWITLDCAFESFQAAHHNDILTFRAEKAVQGLPLARAWAATPPAIAGVGGEKRCRTRDRILAGGWRSPSRRSWRPSSEWAAPMGFQGLNRMNWYVNFTIGVCLMRSWKC